MASYSSFVATSISPQNNMSVQESGFFVFITLLTLIICSWSHKTSILLSNGGFIGTYSRFQESFIGNMNTA